MYLDNLCFIRTTSSQNNPRKEKCRTSNRQTGENRSGTSRSQSNRKKSWAEIVHEDIKKVTKEEVDRMAEDFEKEKKKWNEGKNIIRNDYLN